MDKGNFEKLRAIKTELRLIDREIKEASSRTVKDKVKGSMPEHPYTEIGIVIEGADQSASGRLYRKRLHKREELQECIEQMEDELDSEEDPLMRSILRLYYRNGLSQEKVAEELGIKNQETISRKLKKFWESHTKS